MKKILKFPIIIALLTLFFGQTIIAQTATIRATYTCTSTRAAVNFTVSIPGGGFYGGTTSASGDVLYSIGGGPAGTYYINIESGVGGTPTVFAMTKSGASINAFFTVATPGLPHFNINGFVAGDLSGGVFDLYKCGASSTAPVTNTSTRTSYIGKYRFTVYNSNTSGTAGTMISQTAWLSSFPSTVTLPFPTGQYLVVRLEIQNTCGTTSTGIEDAWIRWNLGTAPSSINVEQSLNSPSACGGTYSTYNNINPAATFLMRPFQGGTSTTAGTNYTQHRIIIQECTSTGVLVGSPVADATFSNNVGDNLTGKSFADIFTVGGITGPIPPWITMASPWQNGYTSKYWRMTISFYSPGCGWTASLLHYFKINASCPNWYSLTNPGGDETSEAQEQNTMLERGSTSEQPTVIVASPNPVYEILQLNVSSLVGLEMQVGLFDMTGKQVMSRGSSVINDEQLFFDVSSLSPGTYFYRCQTGKTQYQGKFVKM